MKYSREGTREFVNYKYTELSVTNIKEACQIHFNEKRDCDVLASDQGPSRTRIDQITTYLLLGSSDSIRSQWSKTNICFVRFLNEGQALVNKPNERSSVMVRSLQSQLEVESPEIKRSKMSVSVSVIPKHVSVLDMLDLGKVISKKTQSNWTLRRKIWSWW